MTTLPIQTIPAGSTTASVASPTKPAVWLLSRKDQSPVAVTPGHLQAGGYTVMECTSAGLALRHFRRAHGTNELVITGAIEPAGTKVLHRRNALKVQATSVG